MRAVTTIIYLASELEGEALPKALLLGRRLVVVPATTLEQIKSYLLTKHHISGLDLTWRPGCDILLTGELALKTYAPHHKDVKEIVDSCETEFHATINGKTVRVHSSNEDFEDDAMDLEDELAFLLFYATLEARDHANTLLGDREVVAWLDDNGFEFYANGTLYEGPADPEGN